MMDDVTYPNTVYGSLSSLYTSLNVSTILSLEKAILHRNLRNFFESLALFDGFSPSVAVLPVVVLEHTWTLIEQYRFREARSVAARGLSSSCFKGRDHGPAILCRALLAGLDALIEGSMSECHASLQEIYDWIGTTPLTDLTDVQSGRLASAHLLLFTETALLPSKDAEIATMESLRSACCRVDAEPSITNTTQPLSYIEAAIALRLALLYAELGDDEGYREEMFNATAAFSSLPRKSAVHSHLLRTESWLARLELARSQDDGGPGAEAWEAFADYAARVGDYRIEAKALTEALESMILPGSEEAEDVLPENRTRLRKRLDGLYGKLGGALHRDERVELRSL
ncbi:MAG: hypothetical protein Q9219_004110 [cf. Caloplaca sp. 3 TL-2023]